MKEASRLHGQLGRRCRQALSRRSRVLHDASPGSVHDLRVATRRLQELVEFLGPAIPSRPRKRLVRRARRIRRSLGSIRNVDVMRELVARLARRLRGSRRRGLDRLAHRLAEQARALRQAGGDGGGLRLPGLRKRVDAVASRLRQPERFSTIRRGREMIAARIRDLEAAVPAARRGSPEALHALRIAVKRYRYSMEILDRAGHAGQKSLRRCLLAARRLQTELGELHDLDILIQLAREKAGRQAARRLLPDLRAERRERARRALRTIDRFVPAEPLEWIDQLLAREEAA